MQAALLESLAGTARAQVISSQLLVEQLLAMNDADTPLDLGFRRETSPALAHRLEKMPDRQNRGCTWDTSIERRPAKKTRLARTRFALCSQGMYVVVDSTTVYMLRFK